MKRTFENLDGRSTLLELLQKDGAVLYASCGGRGTCGKCRVLLNGEEVLACRERPAGSVTVELPESFGFFEEIKGDADPVPESAGLVFDLGTTTVAAALIDKTGGKLLKTKTEMNAQAAYGSDVMTRLDKCRAGRTEEVGRSLRDQIERLAAELTGDRAKELPRVLAGNTIMEHFAAGLDPSAIAVPPFTPQSLFGKDAAGGKGYFLPCISGYVGGDLVAGLWACGGLEAEGLWLYVDIGTNGEIALGNKDGYYCCACAAGPAFEGAEMACGLPAGPGVIDRVTAEGETLHFHLIGGAGRARGICGSGLVDAVARLWEGRRLTKSGRIKGGAARIDLADGVYLTQEDIRNLQLAKGAMRGGMETLLKTAGRTAEDVTKIVIAGNFGSFLDLRSAESIGLLPHCENAQILQAGNASLKGAAQTLLAGGAGPEDLAGRLTYVDLGGSETFLDLYSRHINFEDRKTL